MRYLCKYTFFVIAVLLTSCRSYEYIAPAVNAPVFTAKGQFEGNVLIGTSGFDFQLAYAPIYHLGIIASGNFQDRKSNENATFRKHKSFEFGLGYFKKIKEKFAFEVYGGYGFGNMEGYYNETYEFKFWIIQTTRNYEDYDKAKYTMFFIQPLFGFSSKVFEGGFTPKFAAVNMTVIDQDVTQFGYFFEPVIVSKVGGRHVKFISQLGLCIPVGFNFTDSETGADLVYDYSPIMFCIGVNISFGGPKK